MSRWLEEAVRRRGATLISPTKRKANLSAAHSSALFSFSSFPLSFFLSFLLLLIPLSLSLCVSRAPLVVARAGSLAHPTLLAIHDQFTSRSSTILRADLDLRKIEPCAIALPRSTNPFLRSGAFLESRELSKTVGNVAEFSKVSFQKICSKLFRVWICIWIYTGK